MLSHHRFDQQGRSGVRAYGTNRPCLANSVLSPPVAAWSSAPPSKTSMSSSSQTARLLSTTEPGTIALKLDVSSQVPPVAASPVAVQGTAYRNGVGCTVPVSPWVGPLKRSVICTSCSTLSSPV